MDATRLNHAMKCIDELLPFFPEYGHFNLSEVILANSKGSKQILYDNAHDFIEQLLIDNTCYAKEFNGRLWIELTDKGREAKRLGGHFAYQRKQDELKGLAEEKLKYEVRNVKRIYRTYWVTFWMALLGFLLSLFLGFQKLFG